MTLPALYELAREFHDVAQQLAELDDPHAVADTLEGYSAPLETKAVNVAAFIRNLESFAEQIRAAEDAMATRRKVLVAKAARVREYLKSCLEIAGVTEISCPQFKIAVRHNPPSVVVTNAEALPLEYVTLPAPVPNKTRLATDLKAGIQVRGAHLDESRTRLEIK